MSSSDPAPHYVAPSTPAGSELSPAWPMLAAMAGVGASYLWWTQWHRAIAAHLPGAPASINGSSATKSGPVSLEGMKGQLPVFSVDTVVDTTQSLRDELDTQEADTAELTESAAEFIAHTAPRTALAEPENGAELGLPLMSADPVASASVEMSAPALTVSTPWTPAAAVLASVDMPSDVPADVTVAVGAHLHAFTPGLGDGVSSTALARASALPAISPESDITAVLPPAVEGIVTEVLGVQGVNASDTPSKPRTKRKSAIPNAL